mmetsp:Transcript_9423/g.27502  ORF Transcript_9423/g.27502 Transcript_9423/m.27502 type:complete len:389 (+) Transcript_9423:289-1455(+)
MRNGDWRRAAKSRENHTQGAARAARCPGRGPRSVVAQGEKVIGSHVGSPVLKGHCGQVVRRRHEGVCECPRRFSERLGLRGALVVEAQGGEEGLHHADARLAHVRVGHVAEVVWHEGHMRRGCGHVDLRGRVVRVRAQDREHAVRQLALLQLAADVVEAPDLHVRVLGRRDDHIVLDDERAHRTRVAPEHVAEAAVHRVAHLDRALLAAVGDEAVVHVEAPDLVAPVAILYVVLAPKLHAPVLAGADELRASALEARDGVGVERADVHAPLRAHVPLSDLMVPGSAVQLLATIDGEQAAHVAVVPGHGGDHPLGAHVHEADVFVHCAHEQTGVLEGLHGQDEAMCTQVAVKHTVVNTRSVEVQRGGVGHTGQIPPADRAVVASAPDAV